MSFDRKEYMKQYREKNKEKIKQKNKEYHQKNKDKIKEYQQKNKDKIKEYDKEYRQTPSGKKSKRISNWKRSGVMCDDWDALYQKYINTHFCELCNCKLTEDTINTSTTRCLDHCHDSGLFRNVLCNNCNLNVIR
tara:strand:- start:2210 stop:2614 length:405 start_codon:yes stop_codon:yes gene_type:complete